MNSLSIEKKRKGMMPSLRDFLKMDKNKFDLKLGHKTGKRNFNKNF